MKNWKLILLAVGILSIPVTWLTFPYWSSQEVEITVTDKERAPSNKGGFYMVFTKQGTFRNEDCWAYFKFNSSDLQGKLEVGKTYKAKVYGWRVPFLSKYQNIVKIR